MEGFPDERFLKLIREVRPAQATLVPDKPDAITSNAGWDTVSNAEFLKEVVKEIRGLDVRVSVFVDPVLRMIEGAAKLEVDRIELYTEPYAHDFLVSRDIAIDRKSTRRTPVTNAHLVCRLLL